MNLFTYVESSPIISPAGIIIATRNYKDKKAEEEKFNEKFNILYKDEKDYEYLKYLFSLKYPKLISKPLCFFKKTYP